MPEYRAHFDFDIRFVNGGALSGTGFRLDLPSPAADETGVGRLLVQHLGLALVDEVDLRGLRIVEEPHRGSRAIPARSAGVHVVEHLTNLGDLPPQGARFTAAPPAVEGFGTFPVRAFAEVPA